MNDQVSGAPGAPCVLVAEDDDTVREAVRECLADAGYRVLTAADGTEAIELAEREHPDVAVLDVMLPRRDGLSVARSIRAGSDVPVLFLTARDAVDDRLAGFAAGADDYLTKPFALAELLARIAVVLRRSGRVGVGRVVVGDLVIDEDAGAATRAGRDLQLTATELRLLGYLARHRDRVLSKTQILTQVWGYDAYDPNLVEAFVSTLRRKLELHGPRLVQTVRGIGYRLSLPALPAESVPAGADPMVGR
ncbi:response regulator transcription factor [Nakamurella flava]|uniref:response regulator transcription factor n=1 Tax=Nakamurella flava TaxID=2576308 RepID=UPI00197B6425|nr:response regulator transcription factor [Nakamurella flava]